MIPFWDVHNEDKPDAEKVWFKDLAPNVGPSSARDHWRRHS